MMEVVVDVLQISEDCVRIVLNGVPKDIIRYGGIPPSKANSKPVGKNYGTQELKHSKAENL